MNRLVIPLLCFLLTAGAFAQQKNTPLKPTALKVTNYTAVSGDYVPCSTIGGSFTVTLPTAPIDGTQVGVKMVIQTLTTDTITIACAGSDVFNKTAGSTSFSLKILSQGVVMQYKATGAIWYVIADDLPLGSLDLRYAQLAVANTFTAQSNEFTHGLRVDTDSGTSSTFLVLGNDAVNINVTSAVVVAGSLGLNLNSSAGSVAVNSGTDFTVVPKEFTTATATLAALNIGSYAGDPSSLINGDLWYNSSSNALNARINGATVTLGASVVSSSAVFGNGSDGALAGGAGTTTLTRDTYYTNVTLTGSDKLITAGFRCFINGTLDLTNAPAGAIQSNGAAGGTAVNGTAGAAGTNTTAGTIGVGNTSGAGKAGTTTTGTAGSNGNAANANGGQGGASAAGGVGGVSGVVAGGAAATTAAPTNINPIRRLETNLIRGVTVTVGGGSGASGGSGGGVSTASGASGGTGQGGGIVAIYARTVTRGGSTTAAAIQARGGVAGGGGTSAGANDGGGGGSGGGGGGWIYFVVGTLSGSTATNCFDASGGAGGNGGDGVGSGNAGGDGGNGGYGGRVTIVNLGTDTITETDDTTNAGTSGTAHSGLTHGNGGAGRTTQASL